MGAIRPWQVAALPHPAADCAEVRPVRWQIPWRRISWRQIGLACIARACLPAPRIAALLARWRGLLPISLALLLAFPAGGAPLSDADVQTYRCDGEPLRAQWIRGAVDAPSIPDPSTAPVPVGGGVLLQWRGLQLQLPRTNNAGPASFTDGRWWWSLEDPAHPRFRQRQGSGAVQDFGCERLAPEP